MGFVTLGMFLFVNGQLNDWALKGAIVQMISHGFVSAAMFMCIGVMYDRLHTRNYCRLWRRGQCNAEVLRHL